MEESPTFTKYQLGTLLHWAERDVRNPLTPSIISAWMRVPLVDDPTEGWIELVPHEDRITREEAALALAEHSSRGGRAARHTLTTATEFILAERIRVSNELARLQNDLAEAEIAFRESVSTYFSRPASDVDIDLVISEHPKRSLEMQAERNIHSQRVMETVRNEILAERAAETPQARALREIAGHRNSPDQLERQESELRAFGQFAHHVRKQEGSPQ
jgi:hypothetical protein